MMMSMCFFGGVVSSGKGTQLPPDLRDPSVCEAVIQMERIADNELGFAPSTTPVFASTSSHSLTHWPLIPVNSLQRHPLTTTATGEAVAATVPVLVPMKELPNVVSASTSSMERTSPMVHILAACGAWVLDRTFPDWDHVKTLCRIRTADETSEDIMAWLQRLQNINGFDAMSDDSRRDLLKWLLHVRTTPPIRKHKNCPILCGVRSLPLFERYDGSTRSWRFVSANFSGVAVPRGVPLTRLCNGLLKEVYHPDLSFSVMDVSQFLNKVRQALQQSFSHGAAATTSDDHLTIDEEMAYWPLLLEHSNSFSANRDTDINSLPIVPGERSPDDVKRHVRVPQQQQHGCSLFRFAAQWLTDRAHTPIPDLRVRRSQNTTLLREIAMDHLDRKRRRSPSSLLLLPNEGDVKAAPVPDALRLLMQLAPAKFTQVMCPRFFLRESAIRELLSNPKFGMKTSIEPKTIDEVIAVLQCMFDATAGDDNGLVSKLLVATCIAATPTATTASGNVHSDEVLSVEVGRARRFLRDFSWSLVIHLAEISTSSWRWTSGDAMKRLPVVIAATPFDNSSDLNYYNTTEKVVLPSRLSLRGPGMYESALKLITESLIPPRRFLEELVGFRYRLCVGLNRHVVPFIVERAFSSPMKSPLKPPPIAAVLAHLRQLVSDSSLPAVPVWLVNASLSSCYTTLTSELRSELERHCAETDLTEDNMLFVLPEANKPVVKYSDLIAALGPAAPPAEVNALSRGVSDISVTPLESDVSLRALQIAHFLHHDRSGCASSTADLAAPLVPAWWARSRNGASLLLHHEGCRLQYGHQNSPFCYMECFAAAQVIDTFPESFGSLRPHFYQAQELRKFPPLYDAVKVVMATRRRVPHPRAVLRAIRRYDAVTVLPDTTNPPTATKHWSWASVDHTPAVSEAEAAVLDQLHPPQCGESPLHVYAQLLRLLLHCCSQYELPYSTIKEDEGDEAPLAASWLRVPATDGRLMVATGPSALIAVADQPLLLRRIKPGSVPLVHRFVSHTTAFSLGVPSIAHALLERPRLVVPLDANTASHVPVDVAFAAMRLSVFFRSPLWDRVRQRLLSTAAAEWRRDNHSTASTLRSGSMVGFRCPTRVTLVRSIELEITHRAMAEPKVNLAVATETPLAAIDTVASSPGEDDHDEGASSVLLVALESSANSQMPLTFVVASAIQKVIAGPFSKTFPLIPLCAVLDLMTNVNCTRSLSSESSNNLATLAHERMTMLGCSEDDEGSCDGSAGHCGDEQRNVAEVLKTWEVTVGRLLPLHLKREGERDMEWGRGGNSVVPDGVLMRYGTTPVPVDPSLVSLLSTGGVTAMRCIPVKAKAAAPCGVVYQVHGNGHCPPLSDAHSPSVHLFSFIHVDGASPQLGNDNIA